jgi:hypothetical protein
MDVVIPTEESVPKCSLCKRRPSSSECGLCKERICSEPSCVAFFALWHVFDCAWSAPTPIVRAPISMKRRAHETLDTDVDEQEEMRIPSSTFRIPRRAKRLTSMDYVPTLDELLTPRAAYDGFYTRGELKNLIRTICSSNGANSFSEFESLAPTIGRAFDLGCFCDENDRCSPIMRFKTATTLTRVLVHIARFNTTPWLAIMRESRRFTVTWKIMRHYFYALRYINNIEHVKFALTEHDIFERISIPNTVRNILMLCPHVKKLEVFVSHDVLKYRVPEDEDKAVEIQRSRETYSHPTLEHVIFVAPRQVIDDMTYHLPDNVARFDFTGVDSEFDVPSSLLSRYSNTSTAFNFRSIIAYSAAMEPPSLTMEHLERKSSLSVWVKSVYDCDAFFIRVLSNAPNVTDVAIRMSNAVSKNMVMITRMHNMVFHSVEKLYLQMFRSEISTLSIDDARAVFSAIPLLFPNLKSLTLFMNESHGVSGLFLHAGLPKLEKFGITLFATKDAIDVELKMFRYYADRNAYATKLRSLTFHASAGATADASILLTSPMASEISELKIAGYETEFAAIQNPALLTSVQLRPPYRESATYPMIKRLNEMTSLERLVMYSYALDPTAVSESVRWLTLHSHPNALSSRSSLEYVFRSFPKLTGLALVDVDGNNDAYREFNDLREGAFVAVPPPLPPPTLRSITVLPIARGVAHWPTTVFNARKPLARLELYTTYSPRDLEEQGSGIFPFSRMFEWVNDGVPAYLR